MYVLPHIMCGMDIYFGALGYVLKHINTLQKKIIRSINSLPYATHTGKHFKSMNVPKVNDIHYFSASTRTFKYRVP